MRGRTILGYALGVALLDLVAVLAVTRIAGPLDSLAPGPPLLLMAAAGVVLVALGIAGFRRHHPLAGGGDYLAALLLAFPLGTLLVLLVKPGVSDRLGPLAVATLFGGLQLVQNGAGFVLGLAAGRRWARRRDARVLRTELAAPLPPRRRVLLGAVAALGLGCVLTLGSLGVRGTVHRGWVEPELAVEDADDVLARGFPAGYWLDDGPRDERFDGIGPEGRFLPGAFLVDWAFFTAVAAGLVLVAWAVALRRHGRAGP